MEIPQLFEEKSFTDHRGVFSPLSLIYKDGILNKKWIQSNISYNPKKFTLRGLHFQVGEFAQSKLVKVICGEIIDFVVDIRKDSPEYMKIRFFDMVNGYQLFVPRGFAHGFITLKDDTVVQYLVDNDYSPINEGSIYWKHFPEIVERLEKVGCDFHHKLIISEKDLMTKNIDL